MTNEIIFDLVSDLTPFVGSLFLFYYYANSTSRILDRIEAQLEFSNRAIETLRYHARNTAEGVNLVRHESAENIADATRQIEAQLARSNQLFEGLRYQVKDIEECVVSIRDREEGLQ